MGATCDAVDTCTWCKSAAVPSACVDVENAKHLPPAVFACDEKTLAVEEDECGTKKDAATCDAVDTCTWCKSAAVPSACVDVENAKHLPPPIFACDKKITFSDVV